MITATVTQRNIDYSIPNNGAMTPVGAAIEDVLGCMYFVKKEGNGYTATALFTGNEDVLPQECAVFMDAFDSGLPVEPFSFPFDEERYV